MKYDYTNHWVSRNESYLENQYYKTIYDKIKQKLKPKNGEVLDIGGGNGYFLDYLGIKDATVFDISDTGLKYAKETFGYKTIKGDVEKEFPFEDNIFDMAYCCEVLEHLDIPEFTIKEINKILKLDGEVIISVPNVDPDGIEHKWRFKKKQMNKMIIDNGFSIVEEIYTPRLEGGYKMDYLKDAQTLNQKLRMVVSIIGSKVLPYKFRTYITKMYPDKFAIMFIIRAKKIREIK